MTYKEALDWCEQFTENLVAYDGDTKRRTLGLQAMEVCKKAIIKQIPKKPVIKYSKKPITHKYGRFMNFFCPVCGRFLTAMYETDVENGGGIHRNWRGCPTCLQAVDFNGYYHIGKLDDEIDWSDEE